MSFVHLSCLSSFTFSACFRAIVVFPSTNDYGCMSKYQKRYDHEMFFRRGGSDKRKIKRKKKPSPLTNKERQEAVRRHWEINHGAGAATASTSAAVRPRTTVEVIAVVFSSIVVDLVYFIIHVLHHQLNLFSILVLYIPLTTNHVPRRDLRGPSTL